MRGIFDPNIVQNAPKYPIPEKMVMRDISNFCLTKWKMEWISLNQCRQSKMFMPQPFPKETNKILLLSRKDLGRLARFLTGHNFLRRHQAIVNKLPSEDAQCRFCNSDGVVEDSFHIIKRCPQFSELRKEVMGREFLTYEIIKWDIIHEFISKEEVADLEEDDSEIL